MTKQNKFSKIALTAAVVGAAAVVAPVASQAEEVALEVTKVGFVVDGQTKIITAEEYILAVMGAAPEILAEISEGGAAPAPALVEIGAKFVSSDTYVALYMSGNEVTADELTDVEEVSVEGAQELVDGVWTPVPPTELTVQSVSAITDTVFAGNSQLQFAINGGTTAADVAALTEAGYTVKFLSTSNKVTEADGKVTGANVDETFSYQVEISKDGVVVATAPEKTVKVVNASQPAKITKHEIQQPTGTTVNTLVLGSDNGKLVVTEYETLEGKTVKSTELGFNVGTITYKSSNPSVVVVNASGELIPLAEGTANITISKEGLEDYVVPVTVKADARTATTLTGLSNLSLSVSDAGVKEDKEVTVVVKDQYEDLVTGKELTVTSSDATVATVTATDTNESVEGLQVKTSSDKAEAKFTITAAKAGTTTITVKADGKVLGTATVTVKAAAAVASYNLETTAADLTLDRNAAKEDTSLTFKFVSRDAAGLLVANLTGNDKYDITSSNEKVATIDPATLKVVLAEGEEATTGTTTITVKEGTITRATKTITVVDTTPPAVATGLESGGFANFILGNAEDDDATTFTLTYTDAQQSIGDAPALTFVNPVKLASIAIDGTQLTDELVYELVAKSGTNFVTAYTKIIDLGNIGTKIADLVELGNVITVKFVNEAGYDEEYTFTLVAPAEEVAPEDGEEA